LGHVGYSQTDIVESEASVGERLAFVDINIAGCAPSDLLMTPAPGGSVLAGYGDERDRKKQQAGNGRKPHH